MPSSTQLPCMRKPKTNDVIQKNKIERNERVRIHTVVPQQCDCEQIKYAVMKADCRLSSVITAEATDCSFESHCF